MSEAKYMARLIDADKLNFRCNYNGDCSGDISHCKKCDNYVLDYRDIQEQPTAYDVDAVVERLETEDSKIEIQYEYNYEKGLSDGIGKAIEIVKAGGKNDN